MLRQTIAELIVLFFCYSVAGWCMEVILKYIQFHRFINRIFNWSILSDLWLRCRCCNSFSWWTDRKCKLYCDVFGVFCTLRSPRIFCQLVHGKNVPCALVGLQPKANESAWPYLDWKLGIIWNWRCGNCKAD